MNKAIQYGLPVVVLAAVALPLAAWTSGRMVHSAVLDNETQALHDFDTLTVVRREYHGGVFSSSETVVYGLNPRLAPGGAEAAAQMAQAQITVRSDYHHGPFPGMRTLGLAAVDTQLVLPPEVLGALTGLGPGQVPLRVHTDVALDGAGHSRVEAPAFDVSPGQGALLTWRGMSGDCDFSRGLQALRCALSSDGLNVMDQRGSGAIRQLKADFDLHRVLDTMYVGAWHASLGAVEFKGVPAPEFSLKDLRLAADSGLDGDYLDASVALDAGPVQSPDYAQQGAGFEMKFKHLHAPSLAALTKAAREQRDAMPAAGPAALQMMLQPLKTYGTQIALHTPRLELPRAGLTTAEGSLKISGWVALDPLQAADLPADNPMPALAQHVKAELDFNADEALVARLAGGSESGARIGAQLDDLQARGLVLRKDGKLSSHVEYAGGAIKVNGQPYTPPGTGPAPGP